MSGLERKVLLIMYCNSHRKRTRFVLFQHAESKDWTFMSGTCESGESARSCVLRELAEETLDCVSISRLPKNTLQKRLYAHGKCIDVFFAPIRYGTRIHRGICDFKAKCTGHIPDYSENCNVMFATYKQFLRMRIWNFIRAIEEQLELQKLVK